MYLSINQTKLRSTTVTAFSVSPLWCSVCNKHCVGLLQWFKGCAFGSHNINYVLHCTVARNFPGSQFGTYGKHILLLVRPAA